MLERRLSSEFTMAKSVSNVSRFTVNCVAYK